MNTLSRLQCIVPGCGLEMDAALCLVVLACLHSQALILVQTSQIVSCAVPCSMGVTSCCVSMCVVCLCIFKDTHTYISPSLTDNPTVNTHTLSTNTGWERPGTRLQNQWLPCPAWLLGCTGRYFLDVACINVCSANTHVLSELVAACLTGGCWKTSKECVALCPSLAYTAADSLGSPCLISLIKHSVYMFTYMREHTVYMHMKFFSKSRFVTVNKIKNGGGVAAAAAGDRPAAAWRGRNRAAKNKQQRV